MLFILPFTNTASPPPLPFASTLSAHLHLPSPYDFTPLSQGRLKKTAGPKLGKGGLGGKVVDGTPRAPPPAEAGERQTPLPESPSA